MAELQAMADRSPQVQQSMQLQAMIDNSPLVKAQAEFQAMINNSPHQVAQRQRMAGLVGATLQRQEGLDEDELLQGKSDPIQRQELEDEEPLQGRFAKGETPTQRQGSEDQGENRTGMPDPLKSGLEHFSGLDLSDVRVHYNSPKPSDVNALAYAQGQDIHLGPGQEQHLPHEGWHAVQQMQGRVKPTMQARGVAINDDEGLEKEADVMGAKALQMYPQDETTTGHLILDRSAALKTSVQNAPIQGNFMDNALVGLELTFNNDFTKTMTEGGHKKIDTNKASKAWIAIQDAWVGGLVGPEFGWDWEVDKDTYKNKDFSGWNKDVKFPNYQVNYESNGDNEKGFNGIESWWFRLSLDPGVLEIQTDPTPGSSFKSENVDNNNNVDDDEINPIADIVQNDIFDRAEKQDFKVGGGGGHVNVDFKTGFGSDYGLIPHILLATEQVVENLKHKYQNKRNEMPLVDMENEGSDPFIGSDRVYTGSEKASSSRKDAWRLTRTNEVGKDLKGEAAGASWIRDVYKKRGPKNEKTWEDFRKAHAIWLFENPTRAQLNKTGEQSEQFGDVLTEDKIGNVLHYQAVNIDHLLEEVETARRLEFRFLKGQASLEEIINSVRLIEDILKKAEELRKGK